MTITSLADLQKAFESSSQKRTNLPNNYYKFWDMAFGKSATVRFLPDREVNNPLGYMVEKHSHTLEVEGKNQTVPCLKMYENEDCPICKVSADFYKRGDKISGKKFYRKKQHIAQVLVMKDPLPPADGETENQVGNVKLLTVNFTLSKIIEDAVKNGELDDLPYSYTTGTNFVIKKDQQGDNASYILSKFERNPSPLDEEVVEDIKTQLVDLSTLLPKHPGRAKVEALLDAALSGKSLQEITNEVEHTSVEQVDVLQEIAPVKAAVAQPTPSVKEADAEVNSILERIRARKKAV